MPRKMKVTKSPDNKAYQNRRTEMVEKATEDLQPLQTSPPNYMKGTIAGRACVKAQLSKMPTAQLWKLSAQQSRCIGLALMMCRKTASRRQSIRACRTIVVRLSTVILSVLKKTRLYLRWMQQSGRYARCRLSLA